MDIIEFSQFQMITLKALFNKKITRIGVDISTKEIIAEYEDVLISIEFDAVKREMKTIRIPHNVIM